MADTDSRAAAQAMADQARQLETLDRLSQRFGQSLSGALTSATSGGRQLSGVLDDVASALAKSASGALQSGLTSGLQGAARSLSESLLSASFGGEFTPFARGGVVSGGSVVPFASGGVVSAPSYFPLGRGLGLAGEAGPEAIVPLARGADGRLGVRSGGSGGTNVSVTIQARDAESFRRSEAQVSAALARAVARGQRAL